MEQHRMPGNHGEQDGAVLHDRRRPGRCDVDPALVPLLRGQADATADDASEPIHVALCQPWDDLRTAVGVARGIGLMCVAWAGLVLVAIY